MKNKNCPNNSKNTTLSKQFQKYHIVRTNKKILHCPNNSKNTTLSEQFPKYHIFLTIPKIPHCPNNSKNTTLSDQFQKYHIVQTIPKILHCPNNSKITERGKIDTPNIQIYDRSLSWPGTGTSITSGGVKKSLTIPKG
jgi:hypothetical protein